MKRSKFIRYLLFIILAFGLFVWPCPSFSAETNCNLDPELEWILRKIQSKENSLETFVAKFVQIKKTRLLRQPLRSDGLIYFDRAGKMLWKVTKPSPFVVLIIDDLLYLDYPDLDKTQKRNVARSAKLLKKYFGFGQSTEELRLLYEMDHSHGKNPDTVSLRLVPKRKAISKRIESIEVVINTRNWLPEQVRFNEAKGDYTSLNFYFTLTNADLPEGTFSLPSADGKENNFHISNGKGG